MKTRLRVPAIIVWALTAVISAFILLTPSTGWIVVDQSHILYQQPRALDAMQYYLGAETSQAQALAPWTPAGLSDAASRYPNNFTIQLGCALALGTPKTRDQALRALLPRFPSKPSLEAAILVNATDGGVGSIGRDFDINPAEVSVFGKNPIGQRWHYVPPTAGSLAGFDAVAVNGERLDPQNAFFPMMRAIGLFESHRDTLALAEVERAGSLPTSDDFGSTEARALWLLDETGFGGRGSMQRWTIQNKVVFTEFPALREVLRIGIAHAALDEQAGHVDQGLNIRHSVMRCCDLMRAQSKDEYGTLEGIAEAGDASAKPAGISLTRFPPGTTYEEMAQRRHELYFAYLRRMGRANEASWARRVIGTAHSCWEFVRAQVSSIVQNVDSSVKLEVYWIASAVALGNVLWFLAVGGVSFIGDRLGTRLRKFSPTAAWISALILLPASLTVLFIVAGSVSNWANAIAGVWSVSENLSGGQGSVPTFLTNVLPYMVTATLPMLVSLIVVIVAAALRLSPLAAMARVMPIVGLALLLVYAVAVSGSARQDRQFNHVLDQCLVKGEAQYIAQMAGKPWPPVTR